MRKFDKPLSESELDPRVSPMEIQLDPDAIVKARGDLTKPGPYAHLVHNPIYYNFVFQYLGGSLYRAALGYETFWDSKLELKLIRQLDYYLHSLWDRKLYYFEEVTFPRINLYVTAVPWKRGVKPPRKKLVKMNDDRSAYLIPKGSQALARINKLDDKIHGYVDLDFENGEVISISFMEFLNLKKEGFINGSETPKRGNFAASAQRRKAPKAHRPIKPYAA